MSPNTNQHLHNEETVEPILSDTTDQADRSVISVTEATQNHRTALLVLQAAVANANQIYNEAQARIHDAEEALAQARMDIEGSAYDLDRACLNGVDPNAVLVTNRERQTDNLVAETRDAISRALHTAT